MSDILITSNRYDSAGNLAYTVDPQGTIGASEYDAAGRATKRIANVADPDAEDFFTRASITNAEQQVAVTLLVLGLKEAGLWSKMIAVYPFVGGNAASHSENLVAGTFAISWVNAPTQNANGVTGNGSTQYGICSGLTGGSVVPHLCGITAYARTNVVAIVAAFGGIFDPPSDIYCLDRLDLSGTYNRGFAGLTSNPAAEGPGAPARIGTLSVNRVATNALNLYHNGALLASNTTTDTTTPPALDFYVLGRNEGGVPAALSASNMAFFAVHDGLTAAEVLTFSQIIGLYQGDLGRAVA